MDSAALVRAWTGPRSLPLLPELRLHLAATLTPVWEAVAAQASASPPPPWWAVAWPGGQALARLILDQPERVRGRRVFELGCGCGVTAIAAARAGAARVVAVDKDRSHLAVARANLEAVVRGLGPGEREALVRRNEVLRWLQAGRERAGEQPFDLIYADPPYATGLHAPLAEAVLRQDWLCRQGTLLLECASAKLPELFPGWELLDQRRYGTTTVLRLQQP